MPTVLMTDERALANLGEPWSQLSAATRPRAPMLELGWVEAWWRFHRGEGRLLVMLVTDEKRRPIGLAPLYCRRPGLAPRDWLRTVHFLGTGEDQRDELMGEYCTWLAAPESMPLVTRAVAACLDENRDRWDRLRLERLRPEAGIHAELPTHLGPAQLRHETTESSTFRSPVMSIDEYVARLPSANFRHRCRRALREAQALGLDVVEARTMPERLALFAELRRLHQQRWSARGQPGVFGSAIFTTFHESWVARASAQRVWLLGLRQGDRYLAVRYYLRAGDTLYDYVSGVDTTAPSALAPGLVLHLLTLERCQAAGIRVYDFMVGDQEYKRQLAHERDVTVTLEVLARNWPARAWLAARELRRRVADLTLPAAPAPALAAPTPAPPPARPRRVDVVPAAEAPRESATARSA